MPQRFALYYAPAVTHSIWHKAAQWLGRDPAGAIPAEIDIAGLDTARRFAISSSARRYGFHATIKAPMALAPGHDRAGLEAALADFALRTRPVEIGRLKLTLLEGFLALVPADQTQELVDFAALCVAEFEPFRAPMSPEERERRVRGGKLTADQIDLLDRYGYPYVMDEFRFHMTLTDRLDTADRQPAMAAAAEWFGSEIEAPFVLDRLALFYEPEAGAPFERLGDFPLGIRVTEDA